MLHVSEGTIYLDLGSDCKGFGRGAVGGSHNYVRGKMRGLCCLSIVVEMGSNYGGGVSRRQPALTRHEPRKIYLGSEPLSVARAASRYVRSMT